MEKISLPDLDIDFLSAKIDTGAYGISVHVDKLELIDDKLVINLNGGIFTYEKYKKISVKSSFGENQIRYSVFTRIKVGKKVYKFRVSFSDRSGMRYPVLIGRRFLKKFNYIVDVRKKNIYDRNK